MMADMDSALTTISISGIPKIAEGKVRNLYQVDPTTLLFVATDRISAYDVIMENVILSANINQNMANRK
jgi:phosphoribosylaminoimidazole-succinocarboxamide synthase